MGIINVLDTQVANLIAAGEVVERPASVMKELLENSIDAGATQIVAEIKNGGISLMRVTDNGRGMERDDVPVCIKRHATSKIREARDLDGIMTLGFRGEALAAIASVSHLRIMTKTPDSVSGVILDSEAGEIKSLSEAGCLQGTTVIVEELFANVPARRKFLKRDVSEAAAVAAVMEKIALSHPETAIKFISDGSLRFATVGDGKLLSVIYAVLGRDFAKKLVEVHDMTDGVEIVGYIGDPENIRGNRNYQNFFINGRYIKSTTAQAALEQAFSSYIPSDKFPCCVLNLKLHPAFVDVNVHPSKLEVKFSNERAIFNAVYCAVRNSLANKLTRPKFSATHTNETGDDFRLITEIFGKKAETAEAAAQIALDRDRLNIKYEQISTDDADIEIFKPPVKTEPEKTNITKLSDTEPVDEAKRVSAAKTEPDIQPLNGNRADSVADITPSIPAEAVSERQGRAFGNKKALPWYKITGVAFNCYVFVELEDRMLIFDKHAAHERIIFEDMKKNMQKGGALSQILMLPITLRLSPQEFGALSEYRSEICAVGFDWADGNGEFTVELMQIPSGLSCNAASDMFCELAARLADGTGSAEISRSLFYEKALYQASCKAAVKGGVEDDMGHIRWICERLLTDPEIKYCPHGRPVAYEMTKSQFDKQFFRK